MTLEKREEIIGYYDTYGILLTEKQKAYFESYYFDDLSITEIASNFDVSRNAVFDQLKRVNAILLDYEKKLHFVEKLSQIEAIELPEELKEKIMNLLRE